jgi:hypothetical protein
MKSIKAVALLGLFLPVLAMAQAAMPRVDQRQINQETRIDQGAASGSLTPRETARLAQGQQRVGNMEAQAKADGVVTRQERAHLHHAQEVESHRIYAQKHDRQHDFNHNGRVDRAYRR